MEKMCLVVTPDIKKLTDNITQAFPEASKRANLTPDMVAEWVGAYNYENSKQADFIPDVKVLLDFVEKKRNMDGKSFKYAPESITYTPVGKKKQTYNVIGTRIFNKDGKEVFDTDSKDRRKIFANLAVQQGRAVVVEYKDKKYVVNNRNQIISVTTGDEMKWGEENGDRREVLRLSQIAFREKQKAETAITDSTIVPESYPGEAKDKADRKAKYQSAINPSVNNIVGGYTIVGGKRQTDGAVIGGHQENFYINVGDIVKVDNITGTILGFVDDKTFIVQAPDGWTYQKKVDLNSTRTFAFPQRNAAQEGVNNEWEVKPSDNSNVNAINQNNQRLNTTISPELNTSIKTGKWTNKTIEEFSNLIKHIQDEKMDIKRGVGERRSFSSGRSEIHEGASFIIGTEIGTSEKKRGNPQAEYEVDAAEGREQEKLLEAWAKAADLWLNDYEDAEGNKANTLEDLLNSQWQYLNIGSEAEVYEYDANTVLKSINLSHANDNPGKLLDRIAMFNTLFPGTAMEVVGFGRDSHGHFRVIVTQPYIEGTELTDADLEEFHKKYKLEQVGGWFKTKIPNVYVTDLSPSNIIKSPSGRYHIIDADVKYDSEAATINPALEKFKMEVDMLSGYYEGGGTVLKDVYPTLSDELDAKLENYFLGDGKLTIDDYRKLYRLIHPSVSSTPSDAATANSNENANLAASATTFGAAPTAEAQAAAQARIDEQNRVQSGSPTLENKPEKPKSVSYESALKTNNSRVAQFKRVFSPQQIKDRGAMISNIFSRIIDDHLWDTIDKQLDVIEDDTKTEEQKNEARETLHKLRDPLTGRQFAAQDKQLPVILNEIKQQLQWDLESASEDTKPLWQNTIDYFEDLFNTQATLDIEEKEGIRIVGLELQQTASEDESDNQNDGDDEVGHVVSGSDGWNFQVRYTNPFDSLSRKVRGMLYEVERPNSEKDDLGQTRYYPMGQIYASLLSYLAKHMHDSDTFIQIDHSNEGQDRWGNNINENLYPNGYPIFPVLEQMKELYPWVQQIINRLTDDYLNPEWNTNLRYPSTGGAMASQFYTNFRKAYIPYGKIQIGDGKFGVTPLNYEMEERAQYDKLEANYNNRMILTDHSIYDSNGKVDKKNAKLLQYKINSIIEKVRRGDYIEYPELIEQWQQAPESTDFNQQDIDEFNEFVDTIRYILQSYGIDASTEATVSYIMMEEGIPLYGMLKKLSYINTLIGKLDDSKIDSFNYIIDLKNPYGENQWKHFFDGAGLITDQSYMQSFYDSASKKTKYSYSADNYLMKTFRGACMGTKEQRQAYIDEHFGKFEWFRSQRTGEWRNKWLEFWYNYDGDQKEIPYRNIDNVTEYGEDGAIIRQYSKWTPDDVWQVQSRSYDPESKAKTAFYLAPIFSDSPMSMTVKGPRMSMDELLYGYNDDGGMHHQGALVNLVNQELWRIQYVQQRAEAIAEGRVKPIANFDGSRGRKFTFIPELNTYTFENGESFLDRMLRLKKEKATLQEIEASQIQAIKAVVDAKMGEYIYENSEQYSPSNPLKAEQYYNMVYANAAIIQMTTVDLAFYKDDTDFQKRFKEVYAGGIQLNTNSKYGKKTENIFMVADDIITSPSYDRIAAIIDNSSALSFSDKEEIKKSFQDINVADAQAIRSMHSFRSVLDMMGNWTDEMETALQHFKDGTWDRADFDIIYQTIKPFVYSVIERNDGNGGSILVPQQNKNSEICALMMYDLITNGLNDSPVYKALSRFMEENIDADGNPLIDMIQFESAGKVGNQGVINISFNPVKVVALIEHGATANGNEFEFTTAYVDGKYLDNTVENAEANYKAIKEDLDKKLADGTTTQEEYNKIMSYLRPTEDEIVSILEQAALVTNPDGTKSINTEVVHTIPFDNYYQQQPTPEHHIDAEATFGSQARNIAVADLPDDFELTLEGKTATVPDGSPSGKKFFKGKDAIIDFYYELLNENLIEDFFGKDNKGGLKGIFSSKEALRDAVTEIVRGNPKYGRDFAEALQIDVNGNFVLNPNSPTIFNLMQEIVTSFFKNRITKQTINGAALIQAAGIGLDKDLRMVFDKDGKLLGAECLMPLTSKRFFEPLLETKIIDGKEVKILDPKKLKKAGLDKAIGYRIPTENKSSMMPLIIKDFTPLQNGSAIVLPAEITDIAGSDFDVDKMFIMLLSFGIDKNGNPYKIEYDFSKTPKENGRKARNNMLIQMIFGILTSKEGSEQLLNPQGFKDFKRAAKINRILTDSTLREQLIQNTEGAAPGVLPSADKIIGEFLSLLQEKYPNRYEEYKTAVLKLSAEQVQKLYMQAITAGNKTDAIELLLNSSTKDLEKFIKDYSAPESPVYPQTFAHSHAKNMAGANQIGVYAIQGSMDAKYQRADVRMRPEQQFTLNGRVIANVDVSDGGSRLKNVGQMIGASADNGKDPNLSDAGSTMQTAPIIGYMLRTGMSHLEAVLVINQPHMQNSKYRSKNKYWSRILGKHPLSTPVEVTTDMLIKSLISPFELTPEEDKAIAGLCYRVLMQSEAQEYLTQISRADSPNGSMQNSYAKARIQRYKVDLFNAKMGQDNFPFVRIKDAIRNDAIDTTASEDIVREQLKNQRMAFLHGMYSLGINSFNGLVNPYFFGANQWFDDKIVKPILYNLNEGLSNDKKEKIVNGIYVSYITYMLSGASLFGNEENSTMKQKRDYYLESFPNDYIKIIQDNEDIRELLSNILQVKNFGSRKRIILQDVGSLSKGQKQDVQGRFDALLYSDNPVAKDLAKDLLVYSYFDNGLQFTHDSFSHLFSTMFLTSFPVYTETLNKLEQELTPEEEQNFIRQFLLTFPDATYNVNSIITDDNVFGETIRIDLNDNNMRKRMINEVMSPNPKSEGINVYPYIQYNGEVYVLDNEMFEQYPGTPVYRKLSKYSTFPRMPLFSIQMSVAEMAKEFPVTDESSRQQVVPADNPDAPVSHNDGSEDPIIEPDNMYDEFAGMSDDFDFMDPSDAAEANEANPVDTFQSEGEAELKNPFC